MLPANLREASDGRTQFAAMGERQRRLVLDALHELLKRDRHAGWRGLGEASFQALIDW